LEMVSTGKKYSGLSGIFGGGRIRDDSRIAIHSDPKRHITRVFITIPKDKKQNMVNGLVVLHEQCVILCKNISQNPAERTVGVGVQVRNKSAATVNIHVKKQHRKCFHTLTSVASVVLITTCTSKTR
jgi:hypothetical protein